MYFKIIPSTLELTGDQSDERHLTASFKAAFSNGVKIGGKLTGRLYVKGNVWNGDFDIEINGQKKVSFKSVQRSSTVIDTFIFSYNRPFTRPYNYTRIAYLNHFLLDCSKYGC